jgi:hypothetical protein
VNVQTVSPIPHAITAIPTSAHAVRSDRLKIPRATHASPAAIITLL